MHPKFFTWPSVKILLFFQYNVKIISKETLQKSSFLACPGQKNLSWAIGQCDILSAEIMDWCWVKAYMCWQYRTMLICIGWPTSAWWLLMSWCQIGTRTSATTMMIWWWLHHHLNHISQHVHLITVMKQLIFYGEFGNLMFFLLLFVHSSCHSYNTLCFI